MVDRRALALALDLELFKGGTVEDYLERREHLLRADDRALLER